MKFHVRLSESVVSAVFALVSEWAFGAFDPNTIAFYPFDEGSGDVGAVTLRNAVQSGIYEGAVSLAGSGTAVFDEDVPGKYVFDDISQALPIPICKDPQSVYVNGTTVNDGARITFSDIATALSKSGEGTIEFFFKQLSTDVYCSWSRFAVCDAGVTKISTGERTWFGYTPALDTAASYKDEVSAFNTATGDFGNRFVVANPGLVRDVWHHYAIVFSENSFTVVIDYNSSTTLTGYRLQDLEKLGEGSKSLMLGKLPYVSGALSTGYHGKFSCVRVSDKALPVSRFLRCSDNSRYYNTREGENIDMPGTIAFYTFKEGEGKAGESVGTAKIYNDIDMDRHIGTPSIKTDGKLVYDEDAPGKYVFAGFGPDLTSCTTNPMSLHFSSLSTLSANVVFAAVGTVLSSNRQTTVEFFWKLDDDRQANYQSCFSCNDGCGPTKIYLPFAGKSGSNAKEVRVYDGNDVSALVKEYAELPEDGLWHHLALVYDNGSYRLYNDYQLTASKDGYAKNPLGSLASFNLGDGYYKGKVSCLRVSTNALQVAQMLHVSSLPGCLPSAAFRWRLEGGADGSEMRTVVNSVPSYAALNPGQFHIPARSVVANGTGVATSGAVHVPVQSPRKCRQTVIDAPGEQAVNLGSAYLEANRVTGRGFAAGAALHAAQSQNQSGSMTMEAFLRFNAHSYREHVDDGVEDVPHRTALMSHMRAGGKSSWNFFVNWDKGIPVLTLVASCADGTAKTASAAFPDFVFGWHHYAVAYDREALRMTAFCDKNPVLSIDLSADLDFSDVLYYSIGESGNEQPFEGWVDEVRLSSGALEPDRFLVCEGGSGLLLILR